MIAFEAAFTVFSGFGLILSVIPLWWHLKSWNVGACMFMIWTALACLVHFVDSIVWSENAINWAPVWCDISVRVQIAVAVAWPACALCITRRLYHITCTVPITQAEKRQGMVVDLLIAVGIPISQTVVEYTVAGHRFNIFEDFGCAPATYNTTLAYVLVYSWPLVIGTVSACYGALATRALIKRRNQFKDLVADDATVTYSRHWRLIALASVDFCFTIPLAVRAIIMGISSGVTPWISWADTHSGYSHVDQVPRILMDQSSTLVYSLELTRWAAVLCAFVFFGFFGFTNEARRNYRLLASTIVQFLGFAMLTESMPSPGSRVIDHSLRFALPVSITKQTGSRRDSDSSSYNPPTAVHKFDLEVHSHSPTKQSASTSSTSLYIDEVPRIPEAVLDPASVRRPFAPNASAFVNQGDALDRV